MEPLDCCSGLPAHEASCSSRLSFTQPPRRLSSSVVHATSTTIKPIAQVWQSPCWRAAPQVVSVECACFGSCARGVASSLDEATLAASCRHRTRCAHSRAVNSHLSCASLLSLCVHLMRPALLAHLLLCRQVGVAPQHGANVRLPRTARHSRHRGKKCPEPTPPPLLPPEPTPLPPPRTAIRGGSGDGGSCLRISRDSTPAAASTG